MNPTTVMRVLLGELIFITAIVCIPPPVRSQTPVPIQSAPIDLFDYLERIPPDADERPTSPSLQLPGSLNELSASSNAANRNSDLSDWLRWLVLKNLPPTYEDNRRWGLQKSVYDGFRFRREGIKVETERKYKTVKHGTWSRYYLEFIEPAERLMLDVRDFTILNDDRFRFRLVVEAPLRAFGRISQWQRDVQLISLSTNADVTIRLRVDAEVGVGVNPLVFPPEFQFEASVKQAEIELVHFDVHRISQISGPLAEELGHGLKKLVDERMNDFEDKLVAKINQELDKQEDKLRLRVGSNLPEWLSRFSTPSDGSNAP